MSDTLADKIVSFLGTPDTDAVALAGITDEVNTLKIYGNDSGFEAFCAWVDAAGEGVKAQDTTNKEKFDGYSIQIDLTGFTAAPVCVEQVGEAADSTDGHGAICVENNAGTS